jgi:hypothetical protein
MNLATSNRLVKVICDMNDFVGANKDCSELVFMKVFLPEPEYYKALK